MDHTLLKAFVSTQSYLLRQSIGHAPNVSLLYSVFVAMFIALSIIMLGLVYSIYHIIIKPS